MSVEVGQMDDQQIAGKDKTITALLLQGLILMELAAIAFIDSLTPSVPPAPELVRLAPIGFGLLGLIAILLTIKHHRENVKRQTLQIWATFHIVLSVYSLMTVIQSPVSPSIEQFQVFLFLLLIFSFPPILIHVFAGRERT